jgi:hypothetical protein
MWCNAVNMLAKTHDAAMIEVLRPFLKDKVVAGDGAMWLDYEPLRACDEAAIAIKKLLGEKDPANGGYGFSGGFVAKPGATYPKWTEWDKKIAELQKRLDALQKAEAMPQPRPSAVVDRTRQYYEGYLTDCNTNEIRCLWFHQDSPNVGMEMTLNINEYTVETVRDVYDWAQQGRHTQKLSDAQVGSLKEIIGNLPASDKNTEFNRSVFVSIRNGGKVNVFQYNRRHAPSAIQRIYDIGGGYFYSGKD